jgi:tRNA(fMet)-specific endonuclease VapC
VAELIDGADWIGISTIAVGELIRGFLAGSHRSRNESELTDFLAEPIVETLPVDRDSAHIYAELMVALKSDGTPLPSNDVWIAASTIRAGAPLLTFDRHFQLISRLGTILLQPEPAEN